MFKPGGWFAPSTSKTPGQAALEQMGGLGGGGEDSSGKGKDEKSKKDDDKGYSGSGFDPRGLERAAKAAKVRPPVSWLDRLVCVCLRSVDRMLLVQWIVQVREVRFRNGANQVPVARVASGGRGEIATLRDGEFHLCVGASQYFRRQP